MAVANAINESGQVVGFASTPDDVTFHAVSWLDDSPTDLGMGNSQSIAHDVNDAGQIVGLAYVDSFSHATLWQGGSATDLGTLGGFSSTAYAINNAGQIVGNADKFTMGSHAALWDGNGITDLGTLGGSSSSAGGINNAGQIIGTSYNDADNPAQRAVLWQGTTLIELSAPAGVWTGGHAVNDNGLAVGRLEGEPVLWNGTSLVPLASLGGAAINVYRDNTSATAINNAGLIVGYSHTLDQVLHATLWDDTGIVDLNQFLPSEDANAGWALSEARDINNAGVIVGYAINHLTGKSRPFVLTPVAVPEPATWALMLVGLLGTVFMTRRR